MSPAAPSSATSPSTRYAPSTAVPGRFPDIPNSGDTAHRRGLRVVPWTVDDPATMAHLLGLGVDGIITNRPDVLRNILEENGYALPPPLSRH
ncbi:glycerophosphodiester phosphodiesterase [Nocardia carnea]|uniref:glycerophosphodiester phosphodiesterase n=1 Tax=Nocardia carnea TaxID=37328 RepID=UPI003D783159